MPPARVDWTIAATPLRWSVMSWTRAVCAVTSVVLPSSPDAPVTAIPDSTPSALPLSMVMKPSHVRSWAGR